MNGILIEFYTSITWLKIFNTDKNMLLLKNIIYTILCAFFIILFIQTTRSLQFYNF